MTTALLVVDMQTSLVADETPNPDEILAAVGELVDHARSVGDPVLWVSDARVTPDASLHAAFTPAKGEVMVVKSVRNAFDGTDLDAELTILGVERLVVCGMQSDACIEATVRGGAELGYHMVLVADAHTTHDSQGRSFRDEVALINEALTGVERVSVLPAAEVVI